MKHEDSLSSELKKIKFHAIALTILIKFTVLEVEDSILDQNSN